MRTEGTAEIAASPEAVWSAITDPAVIASCVPVGDGVSVETLGPTTFRLRARIGQGFMRLAVDARGELTDLVRPVRGTCTVRASVAGNALEGVIHVMLSATRTGTHVAWDADVSLRGPLAGMAVTYIERDAPGLIDRTIACLRERVESDASAGSRGSAEPSRP